MVTSVSNNTTTANTGAGQSQQKLAGDMQTFLKLLTTQLQYQDPLEPMDSKEFTQQLVSFSGVEQQISTNKNLETLISKLSSQEMSSAVGYIGKDVMVATSAGNLKDGAATWNYSLDLASDSNKLTVKDAKGNVVYTTTGETKAGSHKFTWNGKDANGNDLPEGLYTLEVAAKTQNGTEIASNVYARGEVDGVEQVNGQYYLSVGGMLILPSQVQSVFPKPAPSTT